MPNNVNAEKALRQANKRRLQNRSQMAALRTVVKKARLAAETGTAEEAKSAIRLATKKLDQSAAKNLIHRNKAARTKSRLAKLAKKQPAKS